MTKIFLLLLALLTLGVACGLTGRDPTPRPTRTPRPTLRPTFTPTSVPTLTPTARPIIPAFLGGGTATPVVKTVQDGIAARNLAWAHLSRCFTFDPKDLATYQVQTDWFVKALSSSSQQYGIWRIDSFSGQLNPHDPLAAEWKKFLDSSCDSTIRTVLVLPTATPKPIVPTPVLRSAGEAVNTLWAYLVKCYPSLKTSELEATLNPAPGEYVVKERNDAAFYGIWRVDRIDGKITPDNERARARDLAVRNASC